MAEDESAIAARLEALSVSEIVDAAGVRAAPRLARRLVARIAGVPSRRLGAILARFDARISEVGIGASAREALAAFGARVEVVGAAPARRGGVLVVTNHPGAYDALATIASLGRDDVALVAAERSFLRAMPRMSEHLIFVADGAAARVVGLRRAVAWLEAGHVLVHYGAGAIEPDPSFADARSDVLERWPAGTGVLAKKAASAGAAIVPTLVSGVHSRRAKRLPIVRWAERRGVTTIAPLVQATLPGFRDVVAKVRFGPPMNRSVALESSDPVSATALVRAAVAALRG